MALEKLQTGDLILCHGDKNDEFVDHVIEEFTHSEYEHAAMIIRDPWWMEDLKGIFVLQSSRGPNSYSDIINGKTSGVTLNKLDNFLNGREWVSIRSIENIEWNDTNKKTFENIFTNVHGKPYDNNLIHWFSIGIGSYFNCPIFSSLITKKEDDTFICSGLVSFFYVKLGWCNTNIDWSCQTPANLSILNFVNPYILGDVWRIK